ncbi:MAG: FKBP-type peptidyl-prolyl cis-trans isomerase [Thermoanaerobaculia bacterium]
MQNFNRFTSLCLVLGLGAGTACAADPQKTDAKADTKAVTSAPAADASGLKNDDEKILYTLGLVISRNLGPFALTAAELEIIKRGLSDGVMNKKPAVEIETYGPKIQEFAKGRMAVAAEVEKKAGQAFLDKSAAESGAVKKPSGLVFREIKAGTGASPKATDTVKVHYHGTLMDGTVFDSSVDRKEPATFPLNGVIPCWTEGVALMKVGGKSRLVCPSAIAYGDNGSPPKIKPGATLAFDVELLEIMKPAAAAAPMVPAPASKK